MSRTIVLSQNRWTRTKRKLPSTVPTKPRVRTDYTQTETYRQLKETYGECLGEEVKFHNERRWRFDFTYQNYAIGKKIAIEIEGGTWISGRHNHPTSIQKDMEKYNAAAKLGWLVLKYTPKQWREGLVISDLSELLCAL